jgi:hypothetical protein
LGFGIPQHGEDRVVRNLGLEYRHGVIEELHRLVTTLALVHQHGERELGLGVHVVVASSGLWLPVPGFGANAAQR